MACHKPGDKVSFSSTLTEAGFVEGIAYVFVIAVSPFIWMVRWLATFPPLDTADVVAVSTIQTSQKEAFLALARPAPKIC